MQNRLVKILSSLLAVCLLLTAAPLSGFTALDLFPLRASAVSSGSCGANGNNVTWTLDDSGTLTISGNGKMKDFGSSNAPWFSSRSSVKTVVIKPGVTSIGTFAFSGCSSLVGVTIPNSVTSIGNEAFYDCSSLTGITIPNSVTSIGVGVFADCRKLANIFVDKNNPVYHSDYNCLIETKSKKLIQGCKNSEIPSDGSVTSIGTFAFYGCSSLAGVTIPNGVTSIGGSAFSGCSSLTGITIPNGVTSIGTWAFDGCSSLTDITIPNSVTSIGNGVFGYCSKLAKIFVEKDNLVYHSDHYCLIETKSKTLIQGCKNSEIPSDGSVASIGEDAFYGCSSLTGITIPNSVTSIGKFAFYRCSSLRDVYYSGTEDQWNALNIGTGNDPLLNALPHFKNPVFYEKSYIADLWLNLRQDQNEDIANVTKTISGVLNDTLNLVSISTVLSEELKANGFSAASSIFEGIEVAFDPATGVDKALFKDEEIYETLILDLLRKAAMEECDSYQKEFDDIIDRVGDNVEYVSTIENMVDNIYTVLNTTDKFAVLSEKNKAVILTYMQSEDFENIGGKFTNGIVDIAGDILNVSNTVVDFFKLLCNYVYAVNMSEEMLSFLRSLKEHTDVPAFQTALTNVISSFRQPVIASVICTAKLTKDLTTFVVSKIFDEVAKGCHVYAGWQLAYKAAKAFDDLMFNTSSSIEAFHVVDATESYIKAVRGTINDLSSKYISSRSEEDAGAYVYGMQTYKHVISIDLESSCNFVKKSTEEGLVNKAKNLGHNIANDICGTDEPTTFEGLSETSTSIKQKATFLFDYFMNCWKFLPCYLRKDFPSVYPYYLNEELQRDVYKPIFSCPLIEKNGSVSLRVSFKSSYADAENMIRVLYGTNEITGVSVSESVEGSTRTMEKGISDASYAAKFSFPDADNFASFPKEYSAVGIADIDSGRVYTATSSVQLNSPCQPVRLMIPIRRNMIGSGCELRIFDDSLSYYQGIQYHIERRTDESDFQEIAVINRFYGTHSDLANSTYYNDNTAELGVSYTYRVTSTLSFSNGYTFTVPGYNTVRVYMDPVSLRYPLSVVDCRAPQASKKAPASIKKDAASENTAIDSDGIKLSWDACYNASGYEIYRLASYGADYTKIAEVSRNTLSYVDRELMNGASYTYQVVPYYTENSQKTYHSELYMEGNIVLEYVPSEEDCAHNYKLSQNSVSATCTFDGCQLFVCSVCGAQKTETVPAVGQHLFTIEKIDKPATCSSSGRKTLTCSVCGEKKTELIPVLMHEDKNSDRICDLCKESVLPKIALTSEYTPGATTFQVRVAMLNCVGLKTCDFQILYNASVLKYKGKAGDGKNIQQISNTVHNSWSKEIATNTAGLIYFGGYFKEFLWNPEKFSSDAKTGTTVDIDSNHFEIAVFTFEIIDPAAKSADLSLSVMFSSGVQPVGDTVTIQFVNECSHVWSDWKTEITVKNDPSLLTITQCNYKTQLVHTCTICGKVETKNERIASHAWIDASAEDPLCSVCGYHLSELKALMNPEGIPGDVDHDGKVTASDARLALRRAVNLENFAEGSAEYLACDVDHDGKVTASDARSILRAAVGLEELK